MLIKHTFHGLTHSKINYISIIWVFLLFCNIIKFKVKKFFMLLRNFVAHVDCSFG